ncbi:hypothetical protein V7S43_004837 [Phytophthora oleae]|uniref:Uncharacterized protein n=1 Tax=Phytophthora oleae TaxID=2107226 RepID=A0ABD3FUU9_9STRA
MNGEMGALYLDWKEVPLDLHADRKDRSTSDLEMLAAENERVLSVLEPSLHRLLELTPATGDDINPRAFNRARTTPVLRLRLFPRSDLWPINDSRRAEALSAFSVLIEYSRRLCDYPDAKRTFWIDVLRSRMSCENTRHVPETSLREPEFPLFAVEFRDYSLYNHNVTPPPFVLPEEAVVAFFTTPIMPPSQVQVQPRPDASGPDAVSIELSFANCRLNSDATEAVERVLDRVFAHPTRQFAVSALDLSKNRMTVSELAVVARIARKCRYVYQVSALRLDEIIPGVGSATYRYFDTTPREFLDIMRAVYGVGRSPVLTAASTGSSTEIVKDVSTGASMLRSVSLKKNYVCPVYFAVAVRESWHAFGLFYPRLKRFRTLLGLRNVSYLDCTSEVVEAFTKTLQNPATQLAYGGGDFTGTDAVATELLVCTVKKGANVELIKLEKPKPYFAGFDPFGNAVPPPPPIQPDIREIEVQCELEGLCERETDGAVCVVIPGIGIGWVQRDAVKRIERESLESAWKYQDSRYAVQFSCEYSKKNVVVTMAMLALLGRQIYSLGFDGYSLDFSIVPQIIQYCPNLRHLSLQGMNIPKRDVDALLVALRTGPLRTRLLTLNLNGNYRMLEGSAAL